jgi:hypothetical protein
MSFYPNKSRTRPEKQVEGDLASIFVTRSPSTQTKSRTRPEKQVEGDLA